MDDEVMVEIENAVVSYREDVALRGVSLRVRRGEFLATKSGWFSSGLSGQRSLTSLGASSTTD